jgi:tetratricopeptide (TPR) repeat protein
MAEGPEEIGAKSVGPDPLGARIALDAATAAEAREYLRRQNDIAALQIENLRKQDEYETSHLRWRRFNDQMRGALQMMLVAVGLVVVFGIGAALWNAANDNGLVVDAFEVPPDLAAKGLTGDVIANKVLSRLSQFQAETGSARASASYANNWGNNIKVQIPNTGVSISEFNHALHEWLGHQTRISGEIYRTPDGLAISARAGNDSTPVLKGNEADIDELIDKAAQSIYRSTQPYRYSAWLGAQGRDAESTAELQKIVVTGNSLERAWAYNGLAHNTIITGDVADASAFARKAIASDPSILLPYANLIGGEIALGHDEHAWAAGQAMLKIAAGGDATMDEVAFTRSVLDVQLTLAELASDNLSALDFARKLEPDDVEGARENEMLACALVHDVACFRATSASLEPTADADTRETRAGTMQQANAALERWSDVLKAAAAFHEAVVHGTPISRGFLALNDVPLEALALAMTGDLKRAHLLADTMPGDCVLCLRIHGQINAIEHNWSGAAWWFARAEAAAPSLPLAECDWGRMLLTRGDYDAAIAKFTLANRKGPHFADPLEMWGEALIAKNRSDLALAKFEEADKYAPNWGRLHLKWGEALYWSGNKAEARKQFEIATRLDLSAADKAALSTASTRADQSVLRSR